MNRDFYLILLLLVSFAAKAQMDDKRTRDLFAKGIEKASGKDFTGAIDDFSEAMRLYPDDRMGCKNRSIN